jgi:hypothetical protein
VAVFNTAVDADDAVRALEAKNLPSSAIRRYRRDDPSVPACPETTQEQGATINQTPASHIGCHLRGTHRCIRDGAAYCPSAQPNIAQSLSDNATNDR